MRNRDHRLIAALEKDGYVKIANAADRLSCDAVADYCLSIHDVAGLQDRGEIHGISHRADLALKPNALTIQLVNEVCGRIKKVLSDYVGEDAQLVELGCLVSEPGAAKQPKHPDAVRHKGKQTAAMVSVFVPLIDLTRSMGPLEVWPETHHTTLANKKCVLDWLLRAERGVQLIADAGTAIVMDSFAWHRGMDNFSCVRRPVLYVSFLGSGAQPDGPTWTISNEFGPSITLADFPMNFE